MPSFVQVAPYLSMSAFLVAIFSWRRLHREIISQHPKSAVHDRTRQWHDAIQAHADGIFLLQAVRSESGLITDFEITDTNKSAYGFVGAGQSQLIGRRLRRDYPSAIGDRLVARYKAAMKNSVAVVEEVRTNRRLFSASWLYHQAVPTGDGVAVTVRDISVRKRDERRLRRATVTDELTLLYNRRGFLTLADKRLRLARRQGKDSVLLYVDMDDFKLLNDRYGHAEGDKALIEVGRLLRHAVRDCDVVGRLGGDEFTVMAMDADRAGARLIQKRIEEQLALLNASGTLAAQISLTIGHTRVRPSDRAPLPDLLARADGLLYARKNRRKQLSAARGAGRHTLVAQTDRAHAVTAKVSVSSPRLHPTSYPPTGTL